MFTVYADASGKRHQDQYVLIAGYIGLTEQWKSFCKSWQSRLAQVGLLEFHASDFFNGAGIYDGWQKEEKQTEREVLLNDLATIIQKASVQSFTCIVHVSGW